MNISSIKSNQAYKYILIVVLILCALFVRIWNLDDYPNSLNRDEAALAINARFISQAGRDEWNMPWPVQFVSFGDYKLPGYIYTLVGTFFFLGENDFSVRLPSAVAGIGILFLFLLFLRQTSKENISAINWSIGIILIGFSPFAIFYSRMAWEANVSLLFFLFMLVLAFRSKPTMMTDIAAGITGLFSGLFYNSSQLLLIAILPALIIWRWKVIKKNWLLLLTGNVVSFVTLQVLFLEASIQKSKISIFTDPTIISEYPAFRILFPEHLQTVFGNKYIFFLTEISQRILNTFSFDFLVLYGGTHPWHSILGKGHIYSIVYVFFIIGLVVSFMKIRSIFSKPTIESYREIVLIYLLLVSTFSASITVDSPHATRSLLTFVLIIVFSFHGMAWLLFKISSVSKVAAYWFAFLMMLILTIQSSAYLYQYFFVWPTSYTRDLKIGFNQIENFEYSNDDRVLILEDPNYTYVWPVWYWGISQNKFISRVNRVGPNHATNLYQVTQLDKIEIANEESGIQSRYEHIIIWSNLSNNWQLK